MRRSADCAGRERPPRRLARPVLGRQHPGQPAAHPGLRRPPRRPTTAPVLLFTSGQHLGPQPGELPYVATKGAVHQLTASLADAIADRGITVSCINPGPVAPVGPTRPSASSSRAASRPGGGPPRAVVAWLVGDDSHLVTGQVVNAEAGFRRGRPEGGQPGFGGWSTSCAR